MKRSPDSDLENEHNKKRKTELAPDNDNSWPTRIASFALQNTPNFILNSFNFLTYNTLSLENAINQRNIWLVYILLTDSKTGPTIHDNAALHLATFNGHYPAVQILLQNGRADPTFDNSYVLCLAAKYGHYHLVKLFLQDGRTDPSARNSDPLCWAAQNGHTHIVQLLLQDCRTDPAAGRNKALRWAATESGNYQIVEILLNDERVDPNAVDFIPKNEKIAALVAIHQAAKNNNLDTLNQLLHQDPQITEDIAESVISFINKYSEVANALHSEAPEHIAFKKVFLGLISRTFLCSMPFKIAVFHQYQLPNDLIATIAHHIHPLFTPYVNNIFTSKTSVDSIELINQSKRLSSL